MRMPTAIVVTSIGLVGLMSLGESDERVSKGPRIALPTAVSAELGRVQQSRARLDALRGALLQQKERLRAKSAIERIVLPA
ncbi:hypothetical protein [Rhizobium binae]|uniref:Uncharacterized protein n=1 Tax=Rhizobium binae TaxID=1138190 RepID=A0ABV2MHG0_9HYPH|nr:hypothetical protein [Rhizobium binae]NKL48536.1 hypothetical protein [Rhizobium leguminosarum bv. viciae]MBX4927901.1 hypothetical protein [Rhizobium binae]MBX4938441.1 hypothetical protein [Rhizobium binae]MBX4944948.1 hypothetical protein [Rhizobium binae]MBX4952129.1 hypothetical protein [Rhizobium binae]